MAKKFIIIATARSGSSMLVEFLNNQLNIRCESELLQAHQEIKYLKFLKESSHLNPEIFPRFVSTLGTDPLKLVGNRNRNFIEYLSIWESVCSSNHFGFKLFFDSHLRSSKLPKEDSIKVEDFLRYIKDNDIKIIHLTRDNILLKYVSVLTSNITGVFSSINTSQINSISVEVPYKQFIKYQRNTQKEEEDVVDFCFFNKIEYYHVTYENLIGKDYVTFYKNILQFLGEDPETFIDIRGTVRQIRVKTNIYTLRDKVSNLDDLIAEATLTDDKELLDNINTLLNQKKEGFN